LLNGKIYNHFILSEYVELKSSNHKILIYTPYEGVGHFAGWNRLIATYLESIGMVVKFSTDFACPQEIDNNLISHQDLNNFYCNVGLNELIKKWSPDLVINTFFDSLNAELNDWNIFNERFPYQWSGIYFRPRMSPPLFLQKNYLSKQFYGLQFVVKDDYFQYKELHPDIKASYLPDTCYSELPSILSPLAAKVLHLARGRKIVFMGGSIGYRKNVLQWINLIKRADSKKYYFLQVGKFHYSEFNNRAVNIIKKFFNEHPENYTVIEKYIADEKYFNELMAISDCIFSVYRDFEASSNMVPKTAIFRVPILVEKSSRVMARDVALFNLGLVLPSTNAKKIIPYLDELFTSFDRQNFEKGCIEFERVRIGRELKKNLKEFFEM
jgi:hypothetical protein